MFSKLIFQGIDKLLQGKYPRRERGKRHCDCKKERMSAYIEGSDHISVDLHSNGEYRLAPKTCEFCAIILPIQATASKMYRVSLKQHFPNCIKYVRYHLFVGLEILQPFQSHFLSIKALLRRRMYECITSNSSTMAC